MATIYKVRSDVRRKAILGPILGRFSGPTGLNPAPGPEPGPEPGSRGGVWFYLGLQGTYKRPRRVPYLPGRLSSPSSLQRIVGSL